MSHYVGGKNIPSYDDQSMLLTSDLYFQPMFPKSDYCEWRYYDMG